MTIVLYIKNNLDDVVSIDSSTVRCVGTSEKGESTTVSVVEPLKYVQDKLEPLGLIFGVDYNKNFKPAHDLIELGSNAIRTHDVLPGEQFSGLVLLKQPYGPLQDIRRGTSTVSQRSEVLFKDFTITVPVGGKDYTFAFTVNNEKK